ncbi:MAG: hypothetical protein Q9190_001664 [Brigantiaea leucoxantha]
MYLPPCDLELAARHQTEWQGAFLPLPARLQRSGLDPAKSITVTYYIVGTVSLLVSIMCFFGLQGLRSEGEKSLKSVLSEDDSRKIAFRSRIIGPFSLGFTHPSIGLAYLGGFVARQIGAIVCSLGLLGGSIAFPDSQQPPSVQAQSAEAGPSRDTRDSSFDRTDLPGESTMLLPQPPPAQNLVDLKGSIAGVYSLAGGIGILLLTKLGGLLFDKISMIAPFVILAVFNLLLLVIGILLALFHRR